MKTHSKKRREEYKIFYISQNYEGEIFYFLQSDIAVRTKFGAVPFINKNSTHSLKYTWIIQSKDKSFKVIVGSVLQITGVGYFVITISQIYALYKNSAAVAQKPRT